MYKGQQVEQNFPELGSGSYMKLDMRFADEEDAGDIACVIEISSACEYDESSPFYYRKKSMASASSAANAASFFSSSSTVSKQEIEDQTHSSNTRWIVLETALPEEQVVCAARLIMVDRTEGASERRALVDVLASMPDTQQSSVRAQMLVAVSFNLSIPFFINPDVDPNLYLVLVLVLVLVERSVRPIVIVIV